MLRIFLTFVLPLLLPTLIYFCWVGLVQPAGERAGISGMLLAGLIGCGVLLLAATLFVVTVHFGAPQPGAYVPPRYQNGRVVPAHIDPGIDPKIVPPNARP
jgi:hypothetical protein